MENSKLINSRIDEDKMQISIRKSCKDSIKLRKLYLKIKKLINDLPKNIKFITIKFEGRFKRKLKMIFLYCLFYCSGIEKYVNSNCDVQLTIYIRDNLKIKFRSDCLFLKMKKGGGQFEQRQHFLHLFTSDYLILRNGNSNDLFFNTVNEIIFNKTRCEGIRLPLFYLNKTLLERVENEIKSFFDCLDLINEEIKFEFLCLDLELKLDVLRNCMEGYYDLYLSLYHIFEAIFKKLQNKFVILNIIIANTDECFPMNQLLENMGSLLQTIQNKKYILNFRNLTFINHVNNIVINNSRFVTGQSIFMNKIFCRIENFDVVYLFFFVIRKNQKFNQLGRKYILKTIGKYMVKLEFFELNQSDPENITISEGVVINNKKLPENVRKIFKHRDNIFESKMLLLGKGYNPLN